MPHARPARIPDGLAVKVMRAKVRPGADGGAEADRWAAMADGCVAAFDRERMAVEIVSRVREGQDDYLFRVSIEGADRTGLDESIPIGRDLAAQARRTSAPGWTQAEPQILILPDPVREALVSWAVRAAPDSAEEPTDPAMGDGFAVGVRMVLTPRHQKGAAGRPQRLPAQADVTSRRRGRNPVS